MRYLQACVSVIVNCNVNSHSSHLPPVSLPILHALKRYPVQLTFISIWCLLMVLIPHLQSNFGDDTLTYGIVASTLAQAIAVVAILRLRWEWRTIGRIFAIVALVTFSAEAIGTATGFPFGDYSYTDRLQPQLLHVPLLIPIAWFIMLPSCWLIAHRWRHSRWRFAAVSAAALTSWDFMLDPQMVNWNLWKWANPNGYFGIPWTNFAGWFGVAFVLTALLYPILKLTDDRRQTTARPEPVERDDDLPLTIHNSQPRPELVEGFTIHNSLLLTIFTLTWLLELIGLVFIFNLPAPGLVGGFIMGIFVLLGWRTFFSRITHHAS